ncbi:transposase [Pedobacter antarcticus]|uniref:transposase n=1 Tax=Pedobacter antarcticus TaxID=34086 RepID=UPI003977C8E9
MKRLFSDLKPVFKAVNQEQWYEKLLEFEDKWGKKDPLSVKSWIDHWMNLSLYFEYSAEIGTVIYTTNAIEEMYRQIRRITKIKGALTSDQSLLKLVYLAYR